METYPSGKRPVNSLGNCIGITEAAASMSGKIISISDDLMWRYLELPSFRPLGDIAALRRGTAEGRNPRDVKFELARELVTRFHDAAAADAARRDFIARVSEKGVSADLPPKVLPVDAPGVRLGNLQQGGPVWPPASRKPIEKSTTVRCESTAPRSPPEVLRSWPARSACCSWDRSVSCASGYS